MTELEFIHRDSELISEEQFEEMSDMKLLGYSKTEDRHLCWAYYQNEITGLRYKVKIEKVL